MPPEAWLARLEPDSTGRSKATVAQTYPAGTSILQSSQPLAILLLSAEKGTRCDTCLAGGGSSLNLKRCSGCVSYWYCGSSCQSRAWHLHHKRICKGLSRHLAHLGRNGDLQQHDVMDMLLVAHLVSEHFCGETSAQLRPLSSEASPPQDLRSPLTALLSLQTASPGRLHLPLPPIQSSHKPPPETIDHLFRSIARNHWVVHSSYLKPIAHAVFPVASRLFNHSCVPNAVPMYYALNDSVVMDVKLIVDVEANDEITVPYVDPALPFLRRQTILQQSYEFTCTCPRCTSQGSERNPPLSVTTIDLPSLEQSFRQQVLSVQPSSPFPTLPPFALRLSTSQTDLETRRNGLSSEFKSLLEDDIYLPSISASFSAKANDGPLIDAIEVGLTLLALYLMIYPGSYPLIGLHCLELSKTAWNAFISITGPPSPTFVRQPEAHRIGTLAEALCRAAERILAISSPLGIGGNGMEIEGQQVPVEEHEINGLNEIGPWDEIRTLKKLFQNEMK